MVGIKIGFGCWTSGFLGRLPELDWNHFHIEIVE